MGKGRYLGELEQIVFLGVIAAGREAYGLAVHRTIAGLIDRRISLGALYSTLDRLKAKGYLSLKVGKPTARRGGRRKKYYRATVDGKKAFRTSRRAVAVLLEAIDDKQDLI